MREIFNLAPTLQRLVMVDLGKRFRMQHIKTTSQRHHANNSKLLKTEKIDPTNKIQD